MTIAGVLLAAGGGSRFEGSNHKLTALLRGEPVIGHSLRAMVGAGFNQLVVVTGAVDLSSEIAAVETSTGTSIEIVHNERWQSGQASSLQAARAVAETANHSAMVVGLGDQPGAGIAAWRVVGASIGPIVAASFGGKRRPPVKLDRSVWALLPTEGDEGARVLMERHPELVSEVPCPGSPLDVDTLEDLLAAEANSPSSPASQKTPSPKE